MGHLAQAHHQRHEQDPADETAVPGEPGAREHVAAQIALDLGPVLDQVVDAGSRESADAGREHDLEDPLIGRLDLLMTQQRQDDREPRHEQRQRRHEPEAVERQVTDVEEDRMHGVAV